MLLLKTVYLIPDDECDLDESLEPLDDYGYRKSAASFLLDMDTGPWASDRIIHHCQGLSCCRSKYESKLKLWSAIQASFCDQTILLITMLIFGVRYHDPSHSM